MNNSQPIFIKADFADYNNIDYDTFFKGNVFLRHLTHKINSKKLNVEIIKIDRILNNKIWIYVFLSI